MDIRETIGANLRAYRKSLGLSQEKLAERCGYSRQYIGKIEQAQSNIGIETIERVCCGLNIGLIQLFAEFNEEGYLIVEAPCKAGNLVNLDSPDNRDVQPTTISDLALGNEGLSVIYQGTNGTLQSIDIASSESTFASETISYLRKKGFSGEYLAVRLVKILPEIDAICKKYL